MTAAKMSGASAWKARWISLPLLFTVSACSFAPPHAPPPQPVADRYLLETDDTGSSIGRIGWRDFFADDKLRSLIETALIHNRDVRIASARVAEARAAWRVQGAALYPELDAAGTANRGRSLLNLPGTGPLGYDIRQVTAQLSAGWEIDFWGKLRNLKAAAREQYLASAEARRAVATDLVAQVANGYLLEREYDERAALARQTIATREESLRILSRRYEVGSGNKLDMTQAQTLLAQARVALQRLDQDREVNLNAMTLLVGQPVTIDPAPRGLAEFASDMPLPAGLPSDLLVNRPDIVAAEYQLRAAEANIGAARAAFFPNIQLTGAFGSTSTDLDGLFANGSRSWSFNPTLTLPLFNAGRLKGNLDLAKARQVRAVAEYEKAVQGAFRDVSDALVLRRQLRLQIETTRMMLDAVKERARLAQLRFDNGRSAYLEVLDAQRDLFDTEQTLVQLRRAHLAAAIALYTALGGGFADASATGNPMIIPQPTGARP